MEDQDSEENQSFGDFNQYLEAVQPSQEISEDVNNGARLHFMNQTFASFGISHKLDLSGVPDESTSSILNLVSELLEQKQQDLHIRDGLIEKSKRTESDLESCRTTNSRLKQKISHWEGEYEKLERKLISQKNEAKKTTDSLRKENRKSQQACQALKHKDSQYLHDMRRKEKEIRKIQERLTAAISDKTRDRKLAAGYGMDVINFVRTSVLKGKRLAGPQQLENAVATGYAARHQQLAQENAAMRNTLFSVEQNLRQVTTSSDSFNAELGDVEPSPWAEDDLSEVTCDPSVIPYSIIKEKLHSSIENRLEALGSALKRSRNVPEDIQDKVQDVEHVKRVEEFESQLKAAQSELAANQKHIQELMSKIKDYKRLIVEQERIIQFSLTEPDPRGLPDTPMVEKTSDYFLESEFQSEYDTQAPSKNETSGTVHALSPSVEDGRPKTKRRTMVEHTPRPVQTPYKRAQWSIPNAESSMQPFTPLRSLDFLRKTDDDDDESSPRVTPL